MTRVRHLRLSHVWAGCLALVAASGFAMPSSAQAPAAGVEIRIGFVLRKPAAPPLYEIDPVPEDEGVAGALLGIKDNNTTGQFTGHRYTLETTMVEEGQSPVEAARGFVDGGGRFLALHLPADELLAVADALKDTPAVLFNVAAADDRLRGADCRANLFHIAPSRAMLTDALAQFLAFKRWRRAFLVVGPKEEDKLYAQAFKRSARKFGLEIASEKPWEFGPLARARADSPTTADALVFTRGVDYDVAVVADEANDFGDYIAYRTWDSRLVAGTQSLTATTWHPAHEAWGAIQLQSRFMRAAESRRNMRPIDYQTWVAIRAIGDAVTRTKQTAPEAVAAFLKTPEFGLAAFKGVPVSFRPWDLQLRQPLLVAQAKALVTVAPERGFLHQRTPLDTLGFDEAESECKTQQ